MSRRGTRGGRPALAQLAQMSTDAAGHPATYGVPPTTATARKEPPRVGRTHRRLLAGKAVRGPRTLAETEAELAGLLHAEGIVALVADAESWHGVPIVAAWVNPKRRTSRSRTASTEAHPPGPGRHEGLARRRPGARRRPFNGYYSPGTTSLRFTAELDALGRGAGLDGGRRGHRPDHARTCPGRHGSGSRSGPSRSRWCAVSDHRGGRMEDFDLHPAHRSLA